MVSKLVALSSNHVSIIAHNITFIFSGWNQPISHHHIGLKVVFRSGVHVNKRLLNGIATLNDQNDFVSPTYLIF